MRKLVDVAVQLKYDRIREESTTANQQFLDSIDDRMRRKLSGKSQKGSLQYYSHKSRRKLRNRFNSVEVLELLQTRLSLEHMNSKEFENWWSLSHDEQAEEEVQHLLTGFNKLRVIHYYDHAWNMSIPAVHDLSKLDGFCCHKVEIVEWQNYKHLDWITVRRDDDVLYKFKEGDFHRLRIQDIEDMLLLLVQGKVTNLNVEERIAFNVSLRISNLRRQDAYTPYSDPRGFIYENKDKKNRLMRIDELHKFSDGTLDDVRTALNDRLKGIRMEYLPQTFWSQRDKANAREI
ncbi:hypothetical protein Tco_0222763 [Tanacetum coccineum]